MELGTADAGAARPLHAADCPRHDRTTEHDHNDQHQHDDDEHQHDQHDEHDDDWAAADLQKWLADYGNTLGLWVHGNTKLDESI